MHASRNRVRILTMTSKAVVYIYLKGDGYVPAGILQYLPDQTRSTFIYGRKYRKRPNALPIDPVNLPLSLQDEIITPRGMGMFNALRDAAPDRWGRKVLTLKAHQPSGTLSEFDILTAHHFPQRIGALAFGPTPDSGPQSMAPWVKNSEDIFTRDKEQLRELASIIEIIDKTPEDELETLTTLLKNDAFNQALTSLYSAGGARPKAMVTFNNENWIAKFSKGDDAWNEPLIEHATMTLAGQCGIDVAETRILRFGATNILLVRRFDRDTKNAPRHFISCFTAMDLKEDGDWGSYQDMAWAARQLGDEKAPEQIFRRMVFNAFVANTDDHPRNHAFFVNRSEIRLTPAFDIVPRQIRSSSYDLALRCGVNGSETTKKNLLSQTRPFNVNLKQAESIYFQIKSVVSGWREYFKKNGVQERELTELQQRMDRLL